MFNYKLFLDHNKEVKIGDNLYMTVCGEFADVDNFGNWAQANLRLYQTRHGMLYFLLRNLI